MRADGGESMRGINERQVYLPDAQGWWEDMEVIRPVERRRHPRLWVPFPIRVRGKAIGGEAFQLHTVLDDFSAGGLFLRLPFRVAVGAQLFMVVYLTLA